MSLYVSYVRVSTTKQEVSGLSLEGQREALRTYVARNSGDMIGEFVEVESGRKSMAMRPSLANAVAMCQERKATLLVLRLDRLYRDSLFMAILMRSGIHIEFTDFPLTNTFIIQVFAALAEYESALISTRTKFAMDVAKKRGVCFGRRVVYTNISSHVRRRKTKILAAYSVPAMLEIVQAVDAMRCSGIMWDNIPDSLKSMGFIRPDGGKYRVAHLKKMYSNYIEYKPDIIANSRALNINLNFKNANR